LQSSIKGCRCWSVSIGETIPCFHDHLLSFAYHIAVKTFAEVGVVLGPLGAVGLGLLLGLAVAVDCGHFLAWTDRGEVALAVELGG
jgi:hypothetical protein